MSLPSWVYSLAFILVSKVVLSSQLWRYSLMKESQWRWLVSGASAVQMSRKSTIKLSTEGKLEMTSAYI